MGKLLVLGTSILFIALIFGGFTYILGNFQNNYGFNSTSNYSDLTNAFNTSDVEDIAINQQNQLDAGLNNSFDITQLPLVGGAFSFFDTSFRAIGNAVKPFTIIGDRFGEMISAVGSTLGVPSWVINMFITALVLALLIFIGGILTGKEW